MNQEDLPDKEAGRVGKDLPTERKLIAWGNWKIGLPVSIAMGAGIGMATSNFWTGLVIGLICGGLSGFVIALLKSTVKVEP